MGRPMAEALLGAGYDLRGLDVRPAAAFGAFAAHVTNDPAQMSDRSVLLSVVRDIPQTEAALFGPGGVLAAGAPSVLAICSTVSPAYIRALPPRLPPGVALVDAPMSGAPVAARERRLTFMLGGQSDVIDGVMPLFRVMGQSFHRLGDLSAGMTAKVLNNLIAASSVAATRTALDWGAEMGLTTGALRAVFHESSGQTWFGSGFDRIDFAREGFAPDNTMAILQKDVESLLDAAPSGSDPALARAVIAAIQALRPFPEDTN